jgi:hypothetical protein
MARRSQHSFLKRQKEMKRKDEAMEKMARRHGKGGAAKDTADNGQQEPDRKDDDEAGV